MSKKLVRAAAVAAMVAALTFTPTAAFAATANAAGVRCLITIHSPWGDFCLIPDVLS